MDKELVVAPRETYADASNDVLIFCVLFEDTLAVPKSTFGIAE
jgi:hypothetical protein